MRDWLELEELEELERILFQEGADEPTDQRAAVVDDAALWDARRERYHHLVKLPGTFEAVLRLKMMRGRRPYRTENEGYVGMGPGHTQPGDVAVLFSGGEMAYVLHPRPDRGVDHFECVGETYCHGIMDGEAADRPFEDFYLV